MDKKTKFKNFMKKDGLYVVLFVCLCLVATVAVVTAKKNINTSQTANADKNEEASNNNNSTPKFENAELVEGNESKNNSTEEKDKNEEKNKPSSEESNKKNNSVQTSSTPKKEFKSPIKEGKVTRTYNIKPRVTDDGKTASVFKGIDIEATAGAEVKAISDGKVISAEKGDSKEGYFVKVEHSDDIIAMYANLDGEIKVKVGDKVKQGTVLGKVGNTIQSNPEDRVSTNYLLLHMEKSKKPVDPQKYITNIPAKK